VVTWSAPQVQLDGEVARLPAGIDGEPVMLHLPLRCSIRPGALQVLLPTHRPGLPEAPTAAARRTPALGKRQVRGRVPR
jgi:hypothetical protein